MLLLEQIRLRKIITKNNSQITSILFYYDNISENKAELAMTAIQKNTFELVKLSLYLSDISPSIFFISTQGEKKSKVGDKVMTTSEAFKKGPDKNLFLKVFGIYNKNLKTNWLNF